MIKVTYYYSACVGITTPDVSILCDPWFTDGIYDGSWYQYPKIKKPIDLIGKYDLIYVSHIHPDHYDPVFIKEYLKRYPKTKVIIARGVYLDRKMDADCIPYRYIADYGDPFASTHTIVQPFDISKKGDTLIGVVLNETKSLSDIDTSLVISYLDKKSWQVSSVFNMNDNALNQKQIDRLKHINFGKNPDIALLSYTGAGPYPQTYYTDEETLIKKAEAKKEEFFKRYRQMSEALNAKVNIPFAGQYILGGRLSHLNKYRGVADATEVLTFDPKAIVLEEGASINTSDLKPSSTRIKPYDGLDAYASSISCSMDYMKEFRYLGSHKIKWYHLLKLAYHNAFDKAEYKGDYAIYIKTPVGYACCELGDRDFRIEKEIKRSGNYSLIEIDYRYLFGLLIGVYHWNNAEVGSQYKTTRIPDVYNRSVQRFLNFFTV